MNHLEVFLSWSTLAFEVAVCVFIFARKVQSILPFFAAYACTILASTVGVLLIYHYSGFNSGASYYAYWGSIVLNASARSLAIMELCRYGLRAYRGIWALVWQILAVLSVLLLAHAAVDARGVPNKVAIYCATLDRDLAFASIAIFAALFLIRNYYGLAFEPLQRAIAAGIGFVSAIDVVGNTIIRNLYSGYLFSFFQISQKALWPALQPEIQRVNDLWSTVHLFSFMLTMAAWCYALRKPLPAPAAAPVLLPAEVYREMSPAVNMRLSAFNDRLAELLKT